MPVAPAFSLTLQTRARERALLVLWCALAGGVSAAWLALHAWPLAAGRPALDGLALAAALAAGLPAAWGGWRATAAAPRRLTWDDGNWTCTAADDELAAPAAGRLEPMIDLGVWMLLRFRSAGPPQTRWLVADATRAGAAWHPLRAVLFQPAGRVAAEA